MKPRSVRSLARGMAHRTPSGIAEDQLREISRLRLHRLALVVRERNQTAVGQIAKLAGGGVARELGEVLAYPGNARNMRFLDVKVERARHGVLAFGDRIEIRRHALDVRALDLVRVLLEE